MVWVTVVQISLRPLCSFSTPVYVWCDEVRGRSKPVSPLLAIVTRPFEFPNLFLTDLFFSCSSTHKYSTHFCYFRVAPSGAVSAANVQEKQVKVCNTPCGTQHLSCPSDHSIAIREAAFSVRQQPSPCRQVRPRSKGRHSQSQPHD